MRVFPQLKDYLDSKDPAKRVVINNMWAREQHFTENDIPRMVMASPTSPTILPWPILARGKTKKDISHISIIGVFGLGGHGNAFSIRFAKILAGLVLKQRWAFEEGHVFSQDITPVRNFSLRVLQRRIAAECKKT